MYEFFWRLANRIRHYLGKKCVVRRCCKVQSNLIQFQPRPDLSVAICVKCGSRHFGLTVDPGVIGLRGAQLG
jgi:hypothetical protein